MQHHGFPNGSIGYDCMRFKTSDPSQLEYLFPSEQGQYIFSEEMQDVNVLVSSEKVEKTSTAQALRNTVSNWYQILRDISLVALLSVLVYVGIRILISSTSNDKAKYKQMIIDWIVAICLLFIMQYIMSFSNILVKKFIELIDSTQVSVGDKVAEGEEPDIEEPEMFYIEGDKVEKAYDAIVKQAVSDGEIASEENSSYYKYFVNDKNEPAGDKSTRLLWPAENFMQQARIKLQLLDKKGNDTYEAIGWKLIFVVLVIYTFIFVFTYVKRVVYMAFLTLIAPLVALTYPIDKLNDGKAQAFNTWFKEYIFNLLIQPMHLIIYIVLISSAMDFAAKNIVYVIVALGFMIPAEKLLRKFFGFSKADTPGFLAGPAGAALMMSGMNKLLGKGKGKGKTALNNRGKVDDAGDDGKLPRIDSNFDKDEVLFGSGLDEDNTKQNGNNLNDINESLGIENDRHKFNSSYSSDEIGEMNDYLGINNSGNNLVDNASRLHINDDSSGIRNNKKSINNQIPKKSLKRAIATTARYHARKTGNKINNLHPIKTAAKFAAGTAGALAAGATIGAVAITTGDASKAIQSTAAGAIGGYNLASGAVDKVNSWSPEETKKMFSTAYNGTSDVYDRKQQDKYISEYQKNEDNWLALEQKYGYKEAKRIMDKDVPILLDNGVTDIKDVTAIEDMIKDKKVDVNSISEGIATKKYASLIGEDTTKMTEKRRKEWCETFSSRFAKNEKYKGYDNDEMAKTVFNKVDAFNKKRYK